MRILVFDIGSSSVKAAVLEDGKLRGHPQRIEFTTQYLGNTAQVRPSAILRAIRDAVGKLNPRRADMVALCAMSPSWLAMDKSGKPLTPIVTHQDRRSVSVALELERTLGQDHLLAISGNRPFPGGISSTTAAWFFRNDAERMRRAALVGHLTTYLVHRWTGARVVDPSHASFMGVYRTITRDGWDPELLRAVGYRPSQLPEVLNANQIAGHLTPAGARELSLLPGTPVLPGIMDTSAAVLLRGATPGMLFNVSGSTDVLALCVDHPIAHPQLLTRATGVGKSWMAVSTLASAGTTLLWLWHTLFPELSEPAFFAAVRRAMGRPGANGVTFEPYLAGDRMSVEQRQAAFTGLQLSTTRQEMLAAALDALARQSAGRLELFRDVYGEPHREVLLAGGLGLALAKVLHRDWGKGWRFRVEEEATLRGLYRLADIASAVR